MKTMRISSIDARVIFAVTLAMLSVANQLRGGFANFDSLPEGTPSEINEPFSTGGITFFGPNSYFPPPDDHSGRFVIEGEFDTPRVGPPFTIPNALTMTGYVPGPGGSGGRMGEFWATTGSVENFVSMDIFANVDFQEVGNLLQLEAWHSGVPVASTSVVLDQPGDSMYTLTLQGAEFEEVRLFSSGDAQLGAWFGMVDNVLIVPEPASLVILFAGSLTVGWMRPRIPQPQKLARA